MLGDGLNDAPALAAGHASLSPASAADISHTAADAVLQGSRLAPIVLARCVSCHSPGNIAPHVYSQFSDLAAKAPGIRQSMIATSYS